jgi:putative transposase
MTGRLARREEWVNRKRVRRLIRAMGLEAIHPKPRLSRPGDGHRISHLAAMIDWCSRYVLA